MTTKKEKPLMFIVRFKDRHRMWLKGSMDDMLAFLRKVGCTEIAEPVPIPENDPVYEYMDTHTTFKKVLRAKIPVVCYDYEKKKRVVSDIRDVLCKYAPNDSFSDIYGITDSYSFKCFIDRICKDKVVERDDIVSVLISYGDKAVKPYAIRNYEKVSEASPDTFWDIIGWELNYGKPNECTE